MKLRVLTAAVGIPLLLAFIYLDFGWETPWFDRAPLLVLLVGAAAAVGGWEFFRLGAHAGARPLTVFGVACSVLFVAAALFNGERASSPEAARQVDWGLAALLAAAAVLPLVWLTVFRWEVALESWSWTLAGILYAGWMMGHWVMLRQLDDGRELVIMAVFSTFACDTAAYFVGRAWGRRRMTPRVSPNKTWEGAAAGLAGAAAGALALRYLLNLGDWSLPLSCREALELGALIGVVSQVGDLAESVLKRRAGVKDSGTLLPGHGGLLDRIDSLVFTGVAVYYFVRHLTG